MKIEPGKFYKLRNGIKYRCYAVDGEANQIHGAMLSSYGKWSITLHHSDGLKYDQFPSELDIISEWIDKPEVDWSKMAEWHVAVAMDQDGRWFCYKAIPDKVSCGWCASNVFTDLIPKEYYPKWSGDWKDSLVIRPIHEDK